MEENGSISSCHWGVQRACLASGVARPRGSNTSALSFFLHSVSQILINSLTLTSYQFQQKQTIFSKSSGRKAPGKVTWLGSPTHSQGHRAKGSLIQTTQENVFSPWKEGGDAGKEINHRLPPEQVWPTLKTNQFLGTRDTIGQGLLCTHHPKQSELSANIHKKCPNTTTKI